MLTKEEEYEKEKLYKELRFLLDNYKEVKPRGKQIKHFFDDEINEIIKQLKEIGK